MSRESPPHGRESDDVLSFDSYSAQLYILKFNYSSSRSPLGQCTISITSGGCQMRGRGRIYVAFSHSNNKQGLLSINLTIFSLRLIFAVVYC